MTFRLTIGIILGLLWWGLIYYSITSEIDNDLKLYDKKYKPVYS